MFQHLFTAFALVAFSKLAIEAALRPASAPGAVPSERRGAALASPLKRTRAIGGWTIVVSSDFELVDNGDSWQAHKADRIVYVGSMEISGPQGVKVPAKRLCAALHETTANATERLSHSQKGLYGHAEIIRVDEHWQLKGIMCANGTVATTLIDYPDASQKAWAVATWKSLQHP